MLFVGCLGFGVAGLVVLLTVPLFWSFLAMPGLCCFLRVTPVHVCTSLDDVALLCTLMQLQIRTSVQDCGVCVGAC